MMVISLPLKQKAVAALEEAKAGKLSHVDVFHKYGRDILRSEPDGVKENNLDNLGTF